MGQFLEGLVGELTLYVRQFAWLSTAPRPERKSGLADGEEDPRTRREQMKNDGIEPVMPPLELPYLFDRLMEIGPVDFAGMDRVPVGWMTLRAWCQVTRTPLPPWEARLVRRLSGEWLAETRRAAKVDCPPPFSATSNAHRDAIDRKLAAIFGC